MKQYVTMLAWIAITGLWGTVVLADKKPLQPQARCPVMDGAINKSLFVEYDGKRIYVCCKECIETVKKDPLKYIRELESKGVTLENVQTVCPVMGGKIDKKTYADSNGQRVYFCCAGCIPQFKQDPDKYLKKMDADSSRRSALAEGEGVTPEPVPPATAAEKKETSRMTCPMMPKAGKSEHTHSGGGGCH